MEPDEPKVTKPITAHTPATVNARPIGHSPAAASRPRRGSSFPSSPSLVLLDEPLAAMGAKEGALILDLVRGLKERGEVSVIIIAHNYAQVLEVCDRVNLLQHGRITFDKPAGEISLQELTDLVVAEYRAARTRPGGE